MKGQDAKDEKRRTQKNKSRRGDAKKTKAEEEEEKDLHGGQDVGVGSVSALPVFVPAAC